MQLKPSLLVLGQSKLSLESTLSEKVVAEFVNSMDRYIEILNDINPTVLLFLNSIEGIELEELVRIASLQNKGRYKIAYMPSWSTDQLIKFKNDYSVDAFVDDTSLSSLSRFVEKGIIIGEEVHSREDIFKKLKSQNSELESLTLDLENIIEERTKNALAQKQEVEINVNKVRGVIRLVKELSSQIALEETLLLIRNDLKRFHKINQCILAVEDYNLNKRLYYYRAGSVVEHVAESTWPEIQMIRINSLEDQTYLANELSFPIGQVISVALTSAGSSKNQAQPVIHFEHSMSF
ncbi:MAG: hypothetical protein R2827_09445 [Bdellovibrionales bacterium]